MSIKSVLPFLLVALIGAGCSQTAVTSADVDAPSANQIAATSTLVADTAPVVTYESSLDDHRVIFGVLARELSQINGIKIWQLDSDRKPIKKDNSWIWVVPSAQDDPTVNKDWDGDWTFYMLNKYTGITRAQYEKLDLDKTLIVVTGKLLEDDCGVVALDGNGKCIVNIQTKSIMLGGGNPKMGTSKEDMACGKYLDDIRERFRQFNDAQKPQLRDTNNDIDGPSVWRAHIETEELKELFYSPKTKSCLYLESDKTFLKKGVNTIALEGMWVVIYDTYYLKSASTGEEVTFNDDLPFLQITHRGDEFTTAKEAESILSRYK